MYLLFYDDVVGTSNIFIIINAIIISSRRKIIFVGDGDSEVGDSVVGSEHEDGASVVSDGASNGVDLFVFYYGAPMKIYRGKDNYFSDSLSALIIYINE